MIAPLPIIQCLWVGDRLNGLARLALASFVHHGHPVHLYTYGPVKNVPAGVTLMDADAIIPYQPIELPPTYGFGQGSIAPFSDWFRYKLLYDRGGFWVDTDMICMRPWADLPATLISSERLPESERSTQEAHANCGVLRFPAGDPFLKHCLAQAEIRIHHDKLTWGSIGPRLVEEAFSIFPEYAAYRLPPEAFCSLDNWEVARLIEPNSPWHPDPEALAVHCWHELWRHSMSTLKTLPWHERWFYWLNPTRTLHTDRCYPLTTHMGQWQAQYH